MSITRTVSPKNHMSEVFLKTVPRKVFVWLGNMESPHQDEGYWDGLSWRQTDSYGELVLTSEEDSFIIRWSGHWDEPAELAGSDTRFADLTQDLDIFCDIEHKIYDRLSAYEQHLVEQKDSQ